MSIHETKHGIAELLANISLSHIPHVFISDKSHLLIDFLMYSDGLNCDNKLIHGLFTQPLSEHQHDVLMKRVSKRIVEHIQLPSDVLYNNTVHLCSILCSIGQSRTNSSPPVHTNAFILCKLTTLALIDAIGTLCINPTASTRNDQCTHDTNEYVNTGSPINTLVVGRVYIHTSTFNHILCSTCGILSHCYHNTTGERSSLICQLVHESIRKLFSILPLNAPAQKRQQPTKVMYTYATSTTYRYCVHRRDFYCNRQYDVH